MIVPSGRLHKNLNQGAIAHRFLIITLVKDWVTQSIMKISVRKFKFLPLLKALEPSSGPPQLLSINLQDGLRFPTQPRHWPTSLTSPSQPNRIILTGSTMVSISPSSPWTTTLTSGTSPSIPTSAEPIGFSRSAKIGSSRILLGKKLTSTSTGIK